MRIVVNHLTRMGAGYICVAGVDMQTGKHLRPVLADGPLPVDFLVRYRGPFDMARIVELGSARSCPVKPHVEDCVIVPSRLRSLATLPAAEFWDLLQRLSKEPLRALFGPDLVCVGGEAWAVRPGKGDVSLGCFRPKTRLRLQYHETSPSGKPAIRIAFHDAEMAVNVAVTDIRFYSDDHLTPRRDLVERAARRLQQPSGVILGVGLTRPFASKPQGDPRCWLQVTNIHFEKNAAWQLG